MFNLILLVAIAILSLPWVLTGVFLWRDCINELIVWRRKARSNGNCLPLPPAPPPITRIKAPPGNHLAECGGPCWEECWEACDCGLFEQLNPTTARKDRSTR